MELYLDSANLKEIEEGFKLGFLNGLTTTPTFMQREGITDIDGMIVIMSENIQKMNVYVSKPTDLPCPHSGINQTDIDVVSIRIGMRLNELQ